MCIRDRFVLSLRCDQPGACMKGSSPSQGRGHPYGGPSRPTCSALRARQGTRAWLSRTDATALARSGWSVTSRAPCLVTTCGFRWRSTSPVLAVAVSPAPARRHYSHSGGSHDTGVVRDGRCSPDSGHAGGHRSAPDTVGVRGCLLYTSPSPRDKRQSRMPSSA